MTKKPENLKKSVESSVESTNHPSSPKKKPKYKKGKFPYTVLAVATKTLYVRKTVRVNAVKTDPVTGEKIRYKKQKQIWRVCDPPTSERAEEILQDIEDDLLLKTAGRAPQLKIFADICRKYEETELVPAVYSATGQKIAGRRSLEGATWTIDTIIDFFGHREVGSISFGDLQDFKNHLIKLPVTFKHAPPRPRSIRSVNSVLSVLRAIFYFAYRRRWLDRIPFLDGKNLIDKTAETRRDKTWTREEEKKALALCVGKKYVHLKTVIICIVDGGFRREELLNSLWQDVNFETGEMIAKSYKGKTLQLRKVYMTNRMRQALIDWKAEQKKIKTIKDKSKVIGYGSVKNSWETIREKIGRPDLRIHDLRHVFGTRLNEGKVPLKNISLLLGHADIKTTQIYLNPTAENLRAATKVLEVED